MLFKIVSWAYRRMVRYQEPTPLRLVVSRPTCKTCKGSLDLCSKYGCPESTTWYGDGVRP